MFDRAYLQERTGSMRQLASIRRASLEDGKGRGMRIVDVDNGSGLSFTVYPDRALDIGEARFQGIPLVWLTPHGPAAPGFYDSARLNWLRSWGGGLLTGCGLLNVGGPNSADGEDHGLHGRLSHTPAAGVNTSARWNEAGEYELSVSGEVRQGRVFGENVLLSRRISTVMGRNAITVEDTVENQGFRPTPFMLLYHMNLGWPLVDEGCFLELPEHTVTPQNEIAAAGLRNWQHIEAPKAGFTEQVFYHDLPADGNGIASARFVNPKLRIAFTVRYRTKELPYLVQWKMMGQGEYVLGLEPGNCYPEGQSAFASRGLLRTLAPGEICRTWMQIELEGR